MSGSMRTAAAMGRRLALCAALLAAGGGLGWLASGSPLALARVAGAAAALALFVAWNTTPLFWKPRPAYAPPDLGRLRWPEAAPIVPSGRHQRLVFCLHGFPSTPADFRDFAPATEARGWDLAAPLLPGCGTDPADLRGTEWSQYLAAVLDEWRRLRPRYRTACVMGASMGGALALALAEETCPIPGAGPDAMATVAAPAVLNAWLRYGIVNTPLVYLARFMGLFAPSLGARPSDPGREGEDGDGRWRGYLGVYPRQTYTLQLGFAETARRLPLATCPTLVCHARGDRMVPFANAAVIEEGLGSDDIEAYVANMDEFGHMAHNLVLYDSQRERVWARMLDFFEDRTAGRA